MNIPLGTMRQDVSGLITDWGTDVTILRRAATLDAGGRNSTAYATVGADRLWIQPMSLNERQRMPAGVVSNVSHIATKRYGTIAIKKEDRIASPNTAYLYDVVDQENWDTHTNLYLNLVRRSA